jgi:hypothetical protein
MHFLPYSSSTYKHQEKYDILINKWVSSDGYKDNLSRISLRIDAGCWTRVDFTDFQLFRIKLSFCRLRIFPDCEYNRSLIQTSV